MIWAQQLPILYSFVYSAAIDYQSMAGVARFNSPRSIGLVHHLATPASRHRLRGGADVLRIPCALSPNHGIDLRGVHSVDSVEWDRANLKNDTTQGHEANVGNTTQLSKNAMKRMKKTVIFLERRKEKRALEREARKRRVEEQRLQFQNLSIADQSQRLLQLAESESQRKQERADFLRGRERAISLRGVELQRVAIDYAYSELMTDGEAKSLAAQARRPPPLPPSAASAVPSTHPPPPPPHFSRRSPPVTVPTDAPSCLSTSPSSASPTAAAPPQLSTSTPTPPPSRRRRRGAGCAGARSAQQSAIDSALPAY